MKKKLSFLIALVSVLTLAFSILSFAGAVEEPAVIGVVQNSVISLSTLIGFLGLTLIFAAGSAFTIIRKKNRGKNN